MKKWINLFYIFFPLIGGAFIGFLIKNKIDYAMLTLPPLAPPKILFPIAWSILYLLLGLSYFLYRKKYDNKKTSVIYYLQLGVNYLWSILFFLLKWRLLSIFWIILLDFLVLYLIKLFSKQEKKAAYLNIPYLIWCLYATYLTIGIYFLNY